MSSSAATASCTASTAIHLLRGAAAHIERTLGRALDPHGITPAQFELLQAIARVEGTGGGCSELARQMAAPGPDVTRMLDRLYTAGLVARERDVKDRRVVHAVMTEKGRELLEVVAPVLVIAEETIFHGVSQEELEQLSGLLEIVRAKSCSKARANA
jgi:DNA-binding MarR family transcriptional regulator